MKYVWEADDIESGRYVVKHRGDIDYAMAKGLQKIGFLSIIVEDKDGEWGDDFPKTVFIAMSDGMVIHRGGTNEEIAANLNENGYEPISRKDVAEMMLKYDRLNG